MFALQTILRFLYKGLTEQTIFLGMRYGYAKKIPIGGFLPGRAGYHRVIRRVAQIPTQTSTHPKGIRS